MTSVEVDGDAVFAAPAELTSDGGATAAIMLTLEGDGLGLEFA